MPTEPELIIRPADTDAELELILKMCDSWIKEDISYGIIPDKIDELKRQDCFLAYYRGEAAGYMVCEYGVTKKKNSFRDEGDRFYEITELYVLPEFRSRAIGRAMFGLAEEKAKKEGIEHIFIATSTKDYRRVLEFYVDRCGMSFWSATLDKKLD